MFDLMAFSDTFSGLDLITFCVEPFEFGLQVKSHEALRITPFKATLVALSINLNSKKASKQRSRLDYFLAIAVASNWHLKQAIRQPSRSDLLDLTVNLSDCHLQLASQQPSRLDIFFLTVEPSC